jgi:murein DD-endopeptidase MepM/ murein hydrolase activator NlpD
MNNQSINPYIKPYVRKILGGIAVYALYSIQMHVRAKQTSLSKASCAPFSLSLALVVFMLLYGMMPAPANAALVQGKKFFSLEKQRGVSVVRPLGGRGVTASDSSGGRENDSFISLKDYKRSQGVPEVKVLYASLPPDRDMRVNKTTTPMILNEADYPVSDGAYTWPIPARYDQYISSPFGYRTHPITGKYAMHRGIDIAADTGTPVIAAHSGIVEEVARDGKLGQYIKVRHNPSTYSLYGHLSDMDVRVGDRVQGGDMIGNVGSTGRSTGAHLDYSLRIHERAVDPMRYVTPPRTLSRPSSSQVAAKPRKITPFTINVREQLAAN